MRLLKITSLLIFLTLITIGVSNAFTIIRNFSYPPIAFHGTIRPVSNQIHYDSLKSNVFIVADSKLTELFDMLAPFYLFNLTKKANVYIVARDKTPILIKRDMYVLPQMTFTEVDSLNLKAAVIIIPALSIRDEHQDVQLIDWLKSHVSPETKMLAICDGASTAAATGLYDGKYLTCHASDFLEVKSHFKKPTWIQNVNVTKSGNLFSTAGVSNAVEGSLTIINELFGQETTSTVISDIYYPEMEIKTIHGSAAIDFNDKWIIAKKVIFSPNKNIGILLENGMNEFKMISILDTYGRTFPKSFKAFYLNDSIVQSKYGLTFIATGNNSMKNLDELHIPGPTAAKEVHLPEHSNTTIITYVENKYPIDICLNRISLQYGHKFENVVRLLLDYN
jgi:putative intracellular protease/amidase